RPRARPAIAGSATRSAWYARAHSAWCAMRLATVPCKNAGSDPSAYASTSACDNVPRRMEPDVAVSAAFAGDLPDEPDGDDEPDGFCDDVIPHRPSSSPPTTPRTTPASS